jgi:tRNA threonylcarbamoyladenosine biosynthesis protein TsaE
MSLKEIEIELPNAERTRELGRSIAAAAGRNLVVTLFGPLGAGKTTLVQGVGEGLDVSEIINSPTFTMLNEYHSGRLPLYHLDLYRVQDDPSSQRALGGKSYELLRAELDEFILNPGITLIEWAETIEPYLPADHLSVRLEYAAPAEHAARVAYVSGRGSQTAVLAEKIAGMLISS